MLTNVAHVWCIYCTDLFQIITESCCLCSHLSLVLFQYNEFHEEQQNENSLLFTLKASVSNSAASCILTNSVRSLICPCHSLQFPPVIPSLMLFLFLLLSFFFFFFLAFSLWNIFWSASMCLLDWLPSSWESLTARCGILRYIFQKNTFSFKENR